MLPKLRSLSLCLTFALLGACSDGKDNPITVVEPGPYADDTLWLCKPGITMDRCEELDQNITIVTADDNAAVFEHEIAVDPAFDCFYIYPTVDLREEPGNMEDVSDDTLMLRPLYNQAARFNQLCNLYAPKYRQMTIGSYSVDNVFESEFFLRGYADVEEAFNQYLLESPNRDFVLMGHSQGSHVLIDLLNNYIENDEELRSRMISALVVGPTGRLQVPEGELSGGTFSNIPLCTLATDVGCIIAYDSIAAGTESERTLPDQPRPCVNPTLLGDNPGVAGNTIYNSDEGIPFPAGVETYWIGYPGLYSAACEADGFLGVDTTVGRTTAFTPQLIQTVLGGTTLHLADYNFGMGDLLRIVEIQAANH